MGNYLSEMVNRFRKKMEADILDFDETQAHDETAPTVYSERRKQMEKRRKEQSKEPIYDFSVDLDED